MNRTVTTCLAAAALCLIGAPALAASSAASTSLESISASVGQSSNSISKSSDSSSTKTNLAQGDYTVTEVVALAERPGMVRVALQAVAGTGAEGEFNLYLPLAAADRGQVAPGRVITASTRDYGVAFSTAGQGEPFYLVLDDAWYRELQTRAVI
jgi:hypothetical protein